MFLPFARQDQGGSALDPSCGGDVADPVANAPTGREIEVETGRRFAVKRGGGLPTGASGVGEVRAVEGGIRRCAGLAELPSELGLHRVEVAHRELPATDSRLIGDDDAGKSGGLEAHQRRGHAVDQSHIVWRGQVAGVVHQRAVAVEKDGGTSHPISAGAVRPRCRVVAEWEAARAE